jgi:hypothetical protein
MSPSISILPDLLFSLSHLVRTIKKKSREKTSVISFNGASSAQKSHKKKRHTQSGCEERRGKEKKILVTYK